jgi:hypothetical protein
MLEKHEFGLCNRRHEPPAAHYFKLWLGQTTEATSNGIFSISAVAPPPRLFVAACDNPSMHGITDLSQDILVTNSEHREQYCEYGLSSH